MLIFDHQPGVSAHRRLHDRWSTRPWEPPRVFYKTRSPVHSNPVQPIQAARRFEPSRYERPPPRVPGPPPCREPSEAQTNLPDKSPPCPETSKTTRKTGQIQHLPHQATQSTTPLPA